MKLLEKDDQITLFRSGIEVDKNLLKYKTLIENTTERVRLKSEDEINVAFNRVLESTSNQYLFLNTKEEETAVRNIIDKLSNIKDFINSNDARKFNILISKKLLESLKKGGNIYLTERLGEVSNNLKNNSKEDSFIRGTFKRIKEKLTKNDNKDVYTINVIELFDRIKVLAGKEREFKDRAETYLRLIHKAKALNQEAQIEKLVSGLMIHIYESVLSVSEINRYINISDLITLQKKCRKQLDIDYIKNFTRVIPDSVAEKKVWADNLCVFDNYVILYYDPSGKSFDLTEKEKEELDRIKKDPILFGVIQGSGKLYYIDSWIDEFCDLTWDQVVEKLSEKKQL